MKITIKFLKPFSDAVGKKEIIMEFDGKVFSDLVKVLTEKYPKLKKEVYSKNDELSDILCVFINDKPISALKGENTVLKNGDEILFFMPVSGG